MIFRTKAEHLRRKAESEDRRTLLSAEYRPVSFKPKLVHIRAPSGAHRTTHASIILISARMAGRSIDFVTLFFLARLLVSADFGLVAIAMILVTIIEAVFELPVSQMLLVEPSVDSSMLNTAFTLSTLRGVVLAMILSVTSWPFAVFYHDKRLLPLVCVLAFAPAIRGVQNPGMLYYDRKLDFKRQIGCDIVSKTVSSAVSISIAYFTHSYWALVFSTVLQPFLSTTISFILVPYRPHLTFVTWRIFSSFLGWLSAGQLLSALTWQCDRVMLGQMMRKPEVGYFTMADNLSALPNQILLAPIFGPLSVSLSEASQDIQRLRANYLKLLGTVALVGFPALSGLALLSRPFSLLSLGLAWGDAGEILRWLALAGIPSLLWLPFNTLAYSLKNTKLVFSRQLLDFLVKVPTSIFLISSYGIIGACITRCLAASIIGLAGIFAARKLISISITAQIISIYRPTIGCIVMYVTLYKPLLLTASATSIPAVFAAMIAMTSIGAIVYIITVATLWRIAKYPDGGETIIHAAVTRLFRSLRRA